MIKMMYLLGMFVSNLTSVYATEILIHSSKESEAGFAVEWIGLIVLSIIGFIFIYRSTKQIKKIKKLQEELDTYQASISDELDTIGGKNA